MSMHPKVYRFATEPQWRTCLVHRFTSGTGLAPARRFAMAASRVGAERAVSNAAISPGGVVHARVDQHGLIRFVDPRREEGPFSLDDALSGGPRWVIDREWIWTFAPAGTVHRYERELLLHDLEVDLRHVIRDITTDGEGGVWLLIETGSDTLALVHVDCRGCIVHRQEIECQAYGPHQIGSVGRGKWLVLLAGDGRWLVLVDAKSGAVDRVLTIANLASCWKASRLTTDGRERIALWGEQRIEGKPPLGIAFVLDASGDVVDGPLALGNVGRVNAFAVRGESLWLATDSGLWRLSAAAGDGSRESDGIILTPALLSPDSNPTRGWLRAELFADLPRGAALEVEYASTDAPEIASQAIQIAGDRSTTTKQKQDAVWLLLNHPTGRKFRFTTSSPGQAIAIPLFESRDRWLWIRLKFMTPPGPATGSISQLRVLYPDRSIATYLPAAFFGERKDPTGAMRRIVGVLESTSQQIDEHIRGIASHIDPETAPATWLDYLGRWLDLPWDDELPEAAKRRLLLNAGLLLEARGTRRGLAVLMQSLLGDGASVRISDLTVDHGATVVGGDGCTGATLPALLAGTVRTPTLGGKAILGRACLNTRQNPLDVIAPRIDITLSAPQQVRRQVGSLLERVLLQHLPAGVGYAITWTLSSEFASAMSDGDGVLLDAEGPGRIGEDTTLGRIRLGGRRNTLTDTGLGIGFRLR